MISLHDRHLIPVIQLIGVQEAITKPNLWTPDVSYGPFRDRFQLPGAWVYESRPRLIPEWSIYIIAFRHELTN